MKALTCQMCSRETPRKSHTQRYCPDCSTARDLERKRLWAREHPPTGATKARKLRALGRQAERAREAGRIANGRQVMGVAWDGRPGPDLVWQVGVAIPFTYAASKNHIYAMRSQGHVALRRESRALRDELTLRLRAALVGRRVAHNKVWLDILVQKPDHRGDAVNVVDLVCDAVKDAVSVDDRWFCLRRVDWEIAKEKPRLFVRVGQESVEDWQVCSYCGRIRPLAAFTKRAGRRLGVDRVCRGCRCEGRVLAKQGRSEPGQPVSNPDPVVEPSAPAARPRNCLKCGKAFDSEGPWNRICSPCGAANDRLGLGEKDLVRQRGVKRHNGELLPEGNA